MANRTYAVHTSEDNIDRLDEWAKEFRRSRNSLFNEAIEMLLDHYDSKRLQQIITSHNRKKAGK